MTSNWQQEVTTPSFIDEEYLHKLLDETKDMPESLFQEIMAKLKEYKNQHKERLTLKEVAYLLNCNDKEKIEQLFTLADKMKTEVYGNRVVLFAPLYLGNKCTNLCTYCGFNATNKEMHRITLTLNQLEKEVKVLEQKGHKRLILVYGTHADYSARFMAETVQKVYSTKTEDGGEIRRVNINAAPLSVEDFKIVGEAGIGTYQIFQETYHTKTYAKAHPAGEKSNFKWRLFSMDRAQKAGIDDVGLGVLFGLYNWKFEVLALLTHTYYLEDTYGVGPHTLSFPRLKDASGVNHDATHELSDYDLKRVIATLRLAVPYTGLILTAREEAALRRECLKIGVSQIDAGTQIELESYSNKETAEEQDIHKAQFKIGDVRTLDEVMRELIVDGYIPSFCTACYRVGRTGEHFMEFSKPGFIHEFCTPNGLFTLKEYLRDYAAPETQKAGDALIAKELANLQSKFHTKEKLEKDLARIANFENDIFY